MDATVLQEVDLNKADQLLCDYVPRNPAVKHPLRPKKTSHDYLLSAEL